MFQNDKESSEHVPSRAALMSKEDESDDNGEFDEIFPSDLSDDEGDQDSLLKEERGKKKTKEDEGVKKITKKVQMEKSKKKPKTAAAAKQDDKMSDGEDDIADEVIDFDMSGGSEDEAT